MISLLRTIALGFVNQYLPDANRDNLPAPQAPHRMVPTASASLAVGRGDAEPVEALRLDATAQTPHPSCDVDEMQVKYIASKFGLMGSVEWNASHPIDQVLLAVKASPIMALSNYETLEREGVNTYYMPPVSVISSLYSYWRGSIEIRFDIIASQFHVGKLFCVYIPNYLKSSITDDLYKGSMITEFTLKGGCCQFSMVVPYIADRPFWPNPYNTGVKAEEFDAPGTVYLLVATPLSMTTNVSTTIDINWYIRGGDDFEVAVPCQPSIGLSFIPSEPNFDKRVYAKSGYYPVYASTWRNVYSSKKLVLRYGPGSDHVSQWAGLDRSKYYTVSTTDKEQKAAWDVNIGQNKLLQYVFVPLDVNDGYGLIYMGLCGSSAEAHKVWYTGGKLNDAPNLSQLSSWTVDSDYTKVINALYLEENSYPVHSDEYVIVQAQGERDEVVGVTIAPQPIAPPSASSVLFGENFMDLKDICRRYQPYALLDKVTTTSKFEVDYSFPCLPQGLDLPVIDNSFARLCRDGPIPIIASGFRFYRGGLRYKFLLDSDAFVLVQFRNNRMLRSCNVAVKPTRSRMDKYINHGYASAMQDTTVNRVLTVEAPCYFPGEFGLLQRPVLARSTTGAFSPSQEQLHYSLGEMCCLSDVEGFTIMVMYCLADDCRFSVFQGFPPMISLHDIKDENK